MLDEFIHNFTHNLFKPLLLFFYAGFLIPIFKVKFEFPKAVYQALTIYLLLSIGWHGGEELASLSSGELRQALGFMLIGLISNTIIGFLAYFLLKNFTNLRRIDAATVAGYYGSDSAGTFLTAVGVLVASGIKYAAYMPVMLAVMEIPGCLVALYLIAKMRRSGMDALGNMPGEANYSLTHQAPFRALSHGHEHEEEAHGATQVTVREEELVGVAAGGLTKVVRHQSVAQYATPARQAGSGNGHGDEGHHHISKAEQAEADMALEHVDSDEDLPTRSKALFSKEMLHEVFFNPGIYLLFAGIAIGFVSQLQATRLAEKVKVFSAEGTEIGFFDQTKGFSVTGPDDELFVKLFPAMLCLFLLEMGMTASQKLKDLKTAGWQFITFAIVAPNIFATTGILIAHAYSTFLGEPFEIGTYVLFAVLCGAASYIAVPAVQRMAIPEASPTLPLAASLGCTFSYNVTIGIPVYILIATIVTKAAPVGAAVTAAAF